MVTKFTTHIEHFNAGELSPLLRGRIDVSAKSHGFRSLENFYVIPQGGIRRREGTEFGILAKDQASPSKLVPYIINGTIAAIVEASGNTIRVFELGAGEDGVNDEGVDGSESSGTNINNPDTTQQLTEASFDDSLNAWPDTLSGGGSVSGGAGTVTMAGNQDDDSGIVGSAGLISQYVPVGAGNYTLSVTANQPASPHNSDGANAGVIRVVTDAWDGTLVGSAAAQLAEIEFSEESTTKQVTFNVPAGTTVGISVIAFNGNLTNSLVISEMSLTKVNVSISGGSSASSPSSSATQGPDGTIVTSEFSAPGLLVRSPAGVWTYSLIELVDGPYCDKRDPLYGGLGTGTTVSTAGGAVAATITVTSSAALFVSTDADRLIRIRPSDTAAWGYGVIDSYTSSTEVEVYVDSTIASTTTSLEWRLGAWSQTTGYPRASTYHEQRKVYGGTTYQPQTIWGSAVGRYDNFAPDDGSVDENITALTAYTFTLATTRPEVVQWLVSREALLVGTNYQIHRVSASDFNEALNARNVNVKSIIKVGSARIDPMLVRDSIIFPQLYRRQMLEMYYNSNRGRNVTRDIMVGADHIADESPINSSAYQEFPYGIMWFALNNGSMAGLSYMPDEGVMAWHKHLLGGSLTGKEGPLIESMITIPGDTQDEVWMSVKRTVNSATVRTIEVLRNAATTSSDRASMTFLDSHMKFKVVAGVFQNQNLGLGIGYKMTHLEGETVSIMVNDVFYGTDIINGSGNLTTNTAPSDFTPALSNGDIVKIGLPYTSYAETNIIEPINNLGHGPAHDSRIVELTLRLHNSLGGQAGYATSSADNLVYPAAIDPTSSVSPTYTGDIAIKFPHGWERDTRIVMRQADPYPFTATLLVAKMVGGNN